MLERIKASLFAKVFGWIAGLLILCSLVIYGVMMIALPRGYETIADNRLNAEVHDLATTLRGHTRAEASELIDVFVLKNDAYAALTINGTHQYFGTEPEGDGALFSVSINVQFTDTSGDSFLTVMANISVRQEITSAFLFLLPFIIPFIVAIACLGALVISRVLVKPVIELSEVSKRLSELDMTWNHTTDRTDELGVLAHSLSAMAERLDATMGQLEAANRQLNADLDVAKRLERQHQSFFAAVSHELKTPLTIIKAQVEAMIMKIGDPGNNEKYLHQVQAAVEDMETLTREILDIARMEITTETDQMDQVDLVESVEASVRSIQPLADARQTTVSVDIRAKPVIPGQSHLLEKALSNVVGNAVRHSPPGSSVTIRLTDDRLTIENSGVTIPPEDLPDLFAPFHRVEKSRNRASGGSGLGLYIAKVILDRHHLPISVANGPDSVIVTIGL